MTVPKISYRKWEDKKILNTKHSECKNNKKVFFHIGG